LGSIQLFSSVAGDKKAVKSGGKVGHVTTHRCDKQHHEIVPLQFVTLASDRFDSKRDENIQDDYVRASKTITGTSETMIGVSETIIGASETVMETSERNSVQGILDSRVLVARSYLARSYYLLACSLA